MMCCLFGGKVILADAKWPPLFFYICRLKARPLVSCSASSRLSNYTLNLNMRAGAQGHGSAVQKVIRGPLLHVFLPRLHGCDCISSVAKAERGRAG